MQRTLRPNKAKFRTIITRLPKGPQLSSIIFYTHSVLTRFYLTHTTCHAHHLMAETQHPHYLIALLEFLVQQLFPQTQRTSPAQLYQLVQAQPQLGKATATEPHGHHIILLRFTFSFAFLISICPTLLANAFPSHDDYYFLLLLSRCSS